MPPTPPADQQAAEAELWVRFASACITRPGGTDECASIDADKMLTQFLNRYEWKGGKWAHK